MIRAALFDLGGVILSSPFEAFARYETDHDLPTGFLRTVNATDPDTNAWARLERNEIGVREFDERFAAESRALGHEVSGADVLALLGGEVRPAMVEAVRRCSQRMVTGLLTNNFLSVADGPGPGGALVPAADGSAVGEVLALFHGVFESSRVGVRKPDPRFYTLACEALDVVPDECVFLDDLGINLKPARALGMVTIKVIDPDEAIAALEAVVGFALRE